MQEATGAEAPTRRRFLQQLVGSAMFLGTLPLWPFSVLKAQENSERRLIVLSRSERKLQVLRAETVTERLIDYHWDRFYTEHQAPTPATLEGFGTDLGLAAVAIGQLKVRRDDALLGLTQGQRDIGDYSPLPRQTRNVVDLMAAYDEANLETQFPMDTLEFAQAFIEFLADHGLEGLVAMKSVTDFGRIGNLYVWDKVAERWSSPKRVMVANSAWERTFYNWNETFREFENYSYGTEQVNMGWVIEISRDMWPEAELGGFYRWVEDEIEADFDVHFPTYLRNFPAVHPDFRGLGLQILQTLANEDFRIDLLQQVEAGLPGGYGFEADGGISEQPVSGSLLPTYFLNRAGILSLRDPDTNEFRRLVESPADQEVTAGFPMGIPSHHFLMTSLGNAGVLQKKILCLRRKDDLAGINTAVFYLEDYPGEFASQIPMLCGMVAWDGSRHVFIFYDANGQLVQLGVTEVAQLRQSIYERLVIFF